MSRPSTQPTLLLGCTMPMFLHFLAHTSLSPSTCVPPTLAGIAGRFTRQQLSDLQKCAGPQGIAYITRDNQVGWQHPSLSTPEFTRVHPWRLSTNQLGTGVYLDGLLCLHLCR